MCLETKQKEPLIAEEDIPCWIVAHRIGSTLLSYYQECPITPKMRSRIENFNGEINRALHSFKSEKTAKRFMKEKRYCHPNIELVPCYIPKGAEYYKGWFYWGEVSASYASNKRNLIIKKK
jgi:hypothetical protein